MAFKRTKARLDDNQLDLFGYATNRTNHIDTIRTDGEEALARVSPEHGEANGSNGRTSGDAVRSPGKDEGRNGRPHAEAHPAELHPGPSSSDGMGNGEGEIHSADAGKPSSLTPFRDAEPVRNQNNYRITDADRVGVGSLKQKCRDNLAAIELLKNLELEGRPATADEKRVLVRYVGWGGLPQVFDSRNEQWEKERERLESLLTPEELESARATTLNAHYTAPLVILSMYSALQRLGFTHGRILEPALGLGHFIGLIPEEMQSRSLITGIEIDSTTARLARALYPDADIRHQPFEETKLADGFYDVAISNIPFGNYKPFDPRFKSWSFVIHDYFFAAALEKVRPGGLILFVTSHGTLDKVDGALREYIAQKADLLGAIRLPDDAFKRNANTEVTTDILMLRKRLPGELPSSPPWRDNEQITNSVGDSITVNEYFAAHPELMLGEMRLEGRMYQ